MDAIYTDDLSVPQAQFVRGLGKVVSLQFVSMSRDKEFDFNEAVRALLREWRVTRRRKDGKTWGHKEMAAFLDITPVNQIAYETREKGSYPAFVLARFCQRAHMDAAALMDPAEPRLVPLPEQDIVG